MRAKVTATGFIGKDAETFTAQNGKACYKFSIACNHAYIDGKGNKVEETEWVDCRRWVNNPSGAFGAMLAKGAKVTVHGDLRSESYQTKTIKHNKEVSDEEGKSLADIRDTTIKRYFVAVQEIDFSMPKKPTRGA